MSFEDPHEADEDYGEPAQDGPSGNRLLVVSIFSVAILILIVLLYFAY